MRIFLIFCDVMRILRCVLGKRLLAAAVAAALFCQHAPQQQLVSEVETKKYNNQYFNQSMRKLYFRIPLTSHSRIMFVGSLKFLFTTLFLCLLLHSLALLANGFIMLPFHLIQQSCCDKDEDKD